MAETELLDLPPLSEPGPADGPPRPPRRSHKRQATPAVTSDSSSAGARARNRGVGAPTKAAQLGDIHQGLTDLFVALGTVATPVAPATGLTLVARGPQGADAITNLAEKDARVYKALVRMLKYSAWAELAMFGACISVAVAVDLGTLPVDNLVALRFLGEDVAEELLSRDRRRGAASNGQGTGPSAVPSWAAAPEPTG